jgi:hypothetical protein
MTDSKLIKDDKKAELLKYRDLVIATIDYYLCNKLMQIKTTDFDSDEYYNGLKKQTEEHFQKGRLTRLKQWFRDLTEMHVEARDFKFNKYLQDKTNYDIDIFSSYIHGIDNVITKGKISTDKQFYDINIMVDQLSQIEPTDSKKIEVLNKLLADYEQLKLRMTRKPTS